MIAGRSSCRVPDHRGVSGAEHWEGHVMWAFGRLGLGARISRRRESHKALRLFASGRPQLPPIRNSQSQSHTPSAVLNVRQSRALYSLGSHSSVFTPRPSPPLLQLQAMPRSQPLTPHHSHMVHAATPHITPYIVHNHNYDLGDNNCESTFARSIRC